LWLKLSSGNGTSRKDPDQPRHPALGTDGQLRGVSFLKQTKGDKGRGRKERGIERGKTKPTRNAGVEEKNRPGGPKLHKEPAKEGTKKTTDKRNDIPGKAKKKIGKVQRNTMGQPKRGVPAALCGGTQKGREENNKPKNLQKIRERKTKGGDQVKTKPTLLHTEGNKPLKQKKSQKRRREPRH